MKNLTCLALLAVLAAASCAQGEGGPPQVRVGLARHRASVAVGAPGPFVLSAGGPEARGQGQTWTVYTSSSAPAGVRCDRPPREGEVCVVSADGVGTWYPLPVRVRSGEGGNAGLLAGPQENALRRYEGEIEVARDAAGMLSLVNVVDLEAYARGVVCAEMEPNYPPAALEAQAVAARSVALASQGRHRADGFDLCAEGHCQAYRGITDQTPAGNAAVAATRGEILTYNGRPASAVYHAICGGHTENAIDAWGGADVPYLRGVPDADGPAARAGDYRNQDDRLRAYLTGFPAVNCRQPEYANLARFRWVRALTRQQVEKSLADMIDVGEVVDLRPLARGVSGRITRLEVAGTRATSTLSPELVIRQGLGGLPSSAFVVDRYCDDEGRAVVFVLWGAGWGHGVGMCQAGAAGMAAAGRDHREILAKYYPGTSIETLY